MQINLLITYPGLEPKQVVAVAPEIVAFESHFNLSVAALEKEVRYTYMCFLAWHVEKRTGATNLDFDSWVNTIELVTGEEKKSKG